MAHEMVALIAQYGLLMVFLSVLVDQAGAPLPAMPALVVAGALAASGKLSIAGILLGALVGCLLCDLLWYWAGRPGRRHEAVAAEARKSFTQKRLLR